MTWTAILNLLADLGTATAFSVWLPVLAWTALALPTWAVLDHTQRLHPLAEYRLSQLLLAGLPLGIVAVAIAALLPDAARPPSLVSPAIVVLPGLEASSAPSPAPAWTWMHVIGGVTITTLSVGLFELGRLALDALAVQRARGALQPVASSSLQRDLERLADQLHIHRSVQLRTAPDTTVPLTIGGLRPTILVPERLTETPDALRMTLRHELVHIRRWDDLAHLLERGIAAVFALHPLVGRLRRTIAEARERACDAAVLGDERTSPAAYARLLFAFADGRSPTSLGTLPLSESPSSLHDRLSAMDASLPSLLSSRTTLGSALLIGGLTLTIGMVACSDTVGPSISPDRKTASPQSTTAPAADESAYTAVENPPKLRGGLKKLQEEVTYPKTAKKAGIEGRVIVQFVVDADGTVTSPKVVRGIHKTLNQAALAAVRKQTFTPGRRDGDAVPVKMSLPVTFRLPGASGAGVSSQNGTVEAPSSASHSSRPSIKGGMSALQKAVSYPALAHDAGIEGRVLVSFTVGETGDVQDLRVRKGVHETLNAAAIEAVESVSFNPAEKNGAPTAMEMTLPIRFALPDEETETN